ncbi:MAG: YqgE/AlgH family protein [Lacipirellulaceae bacterium]
MPLAGQLLVASRKLRDPNFRQAVVFLLEHNDDGALGVVLNRVSDRTVRQVWQAVGFDECSCEQSLNLGGPVAGPLIALHAAPKLGEKTLVEGKLYLSMQKDNVDPLVRQKKRPFRLYTGNSGWGGGQLEGELREGAWLSAPARPSDIFADPDALWDDVTRRIALDILLPKGSGPVPRDASLN